MTLSLLPSQVAVLRMFALSRRDFSTAGRTDLSEAVRTLLTLPPVAALLQEAHDAFRARMKQLLDAPEHAGGLADSTRLLFEVERGEDAPDIDPAVTPAPLVDAILSRGLGVTRPAKRHTPDHGWEGDARKKLQESVRRSVVAEPVRPPRRKKP